MSKTPQETRSFEERLIHTEADGALSAIREAGSRGEDLVQAWVAARNVAAVLEVAERGDGPARKAARRALNVLSARKVDIPKQRRVATLSTKTEPEVVEAWMMAPDSAGMQLFTIAARAPAGRYRATFVFLHGSQGVARVENATLSQSGLKDYFTKVLPGAGYGATRVPVAWARTRIADARRISKARGLPEPLGFATAEPLLGPVPTEAPSHPFDEEGLELSEEDAAEFAKASASLHNIPEFRNYMPTSGALQELLTKVGEKLKPDEEAAPEVLSEYLRSEVAAATDRFFSPDAREELLRRMKDGAFSVLIREGEQRALEIVATMKVVASAGLVTNPPRDVPFLRAFFDKAIALMAAQGGGRLRIPVPQASLATHTLPVPQEAATV